MLEDWLDQSDRPPWSSTKTRALRENKTGPFRILNLIGCCFLHLVRNWSWIFILKVWKLSWTTDPIGFQILSPSWVKERNIERVLKEGTGRRKWWGRERREKLRKIGRRNREYENGALLVLRCKPKHCILTTCSWTLLCLLARLVIIALNLVSSVAP